LSSQLEESLDRDTRAMERIADAFEQIAKLLAQFYEKMYPPSHEPRDVTLTRLPDSVDEIKANQGATTETTEEWLDIGPREREFNEKGPTTTKAVRQTRVDQKRSGPRPIKS